MKDVDFARNAIFLAMAKLAAIVGSALPRIRTIQGQLGRIDVAATWIYTHVLNRRGVGVSSPINRQSDSGAA